MARVKQTLPPLVGGISQLPDSQKAPEELRSCVNFMPDLVWGLSKRPGTSAIRALSNASAGGSWFTVRFGDDEYFIVLVQFNGTVRVWDALSGEEQTVSSQATAYCAHNAIGDVEVLQVGEFVFILNRTVTVEKESNTTPLPAQDETVKSIADLPDLTGITDGYLVRIKEPNVPGYWVKKLEGDNPDENEWEETNEGGTQFSIDPDTMPHVLLKMGVFRVGPLDNALAPASDNLTGVATTIIPEGSYSGRYFLGQTIYAVGGSGKNLRIRIDAIDSNGAPSTVSPARGGSGFTINDIVTAENGDQFKITAVGSETIDRPELASFSWIDRSTGNDETNPFPSFVDKQITGIGYFANRLVMLSGSNVICSVAGDPLNFFSFSGAASFDSDPVDQNAGSRSAIVFRHAIEYNQRLICVSERDQYSLRSRSELFSPLTAELTVTSRLASSKIVPPLENEQSWIVLKETPSYAQFFELFPDSEENVNVIRPTSINLTTPSFIPSGVFATAISTVAGVMAAVSRQEPQSIFIWKWNDQGRERLQDAWVKFTVPQEIKDIYIIEDDLYIIGDFNGEVVLSRMRLAITNPSGRIEFDGQTFDPRLDLIDYTLSASFDEISGNTRIDISGTIYDGATDNLRVFVLDGPNIYRVYTPTVDGTDLVIPSNIGTTGAVLGYSYEATATLPHIYIDTGEDSLVADPPIVNRIELKGDHTGPFKTTLEIPGRNEFSVDHQFITSSNYTANDLNMVRTGIGRIGVGARGDRFDLSIKATTPLPTNIYELTWEGSYNTKGLRPS